MIVMSLHLAVKLVDGTFLKLEGKLNRLFLTQKIKKSYQVVSVELSPVIILIHQLIVKAKATLVANCLFERHFVNFFLLHFSNFRVCKNKRLLVHKRIDFNCNLTPTVISLNTLQG